MRQQLVLTLLCVALAAAKTFTAVDLNLMARVGEPVPCPLNTMFVTTVNTWDKDANKKTTNLWLGDYSLPVAAGSVGAKRLAAMDGVSDSNPVWSSDCGAIFFLSNRDGKSSQIWGIALNRPDQAYQVTSYPVDLETFKLTENYLLFSARVYPGKTMEQTAAIDAQKALLRTNVKAFDDLYIRHWAEWFDGHYVHLFYVPTNSNNHREPISNSAAPVDVMFPLSADCPSRPFGGPDEYNMSPEETEIAYTTYLGSSERAWGTDKNVFLYNLNSKSTVCISCDNKALDTSPSYSPDSKYIAYLAMSIPAYESDRQRVMLYDRKTGNKFEMCPSWDRSPEMLHWTADSSMLMAEVSDSARHALVGLSVPSGRTEYLYPGDHFSSTGLTPLASGGFIFGRNDWLHPHEIWVSNAIDSAPYRVTAFNDERMSQLSFGTYQEFFFAGDKGDTVQSWFFKPDGWKQGVKYPLVLYIHGGPEDPWYNNWHYRWNPMTITAQGYAVLAVNYRGSGSFGSNWTKAIINNWGAGPFRDLMLGVDAAIKTFDWLDVSRVGAMGASYGGYMINWINTQTSPQKKFKCLICHDGLFDTSAMYFSTEELYFPEIEFGGLPGQPGTTYTQYSPSTYAGQVSTPEMVIHGGADYRVPDTQGISAYNNLQRHGVPSRLLYFPEESHFVLNPNNSLFWHDEVIAWLNRWLK